jgi:hypothetical protein
VPGNQNTPDMTELSYPYRKAVLIDEIRFDLRASVTGGLGENLGSILYAKLQLGQHYLMRDFVPVWLLGTTMSALEEESHDQALAAEESFSHYRWRLAEPLYVEAGQTLRPVFSHVLHNTAFPAGAITAQVSYAGRVVPPNQKRPSVIDVPYAAPFVTTFGNIYQQSNEYNLFNPFDQPLRVQRMTGRVLFDLSNQIVSLRSFTPAPGGPAQAQIQIFDSWGGKVVNDLTGVGDVFDAARAAWTFDTVMPRKGQYDVRVWNIQPNTQVHIAMIGTRQEAI